MISNESTVEPKDTLALSSYSINEEIANSITHGLGVVAGIVGLVLMLIKGHDHLSDIQLTGVSIYGASIIVLFLCSTLYHSVNSAKWRRC